MTIRHYGAILGGHPNTKLKEEGSPPDFSDLQDPVILIIFGNGVTPEEGDSVFLCAENASFSPYSPLHFSLFIGRIPTYNCSIMQTAAYRIIDANFNRAREAARVIEEYCRFALNSAPLSSRAKDLRHQLSSQIAKLDPTSLIVGRDTVGDVGVGQKVENQLRRSDLKDVFTAACKRLTEALRALSETISTIEPAIAETIESLRYQAYTLEKDITITGFANEKFSKVKLYVLITSTSWDEIKPLLTASIKGGADCIQLRAKNLQSKDLLALADKFVQTCKDAHVVSIINDRIDIALAAAADGVHLGANDLGPNEARKLEHYPLIVGRTTHNIKELKQACTEAVTYVSLGPVFKTKTKPDLKPAGIEYVEKGAKYLSDKAIKGVAIGGITTQTIEQVLAAGANAVAICSTVTSNTNPEQACRKLKNKITEFSKKQPV